MTNEEIYQALPGALLPWYWANRRALPWREDRDPYHVWLSEIMLQQTRVEAVRGYYARFLEALPTIEALANADDELLNKLWEGLGYYSRVRNLKKAAQAVMERYNGAFPTDYDSILSLPGIGEYTAGAICSIAFGQQIPAVDGNVLRVAARLTDDAAPIDQPARKKTVRTALAAVYPAEAGDFTQALMELGATVCGPNREPDCVCCPCQTFCMGCLRGTADKLPVKTPPKPRRMEEYTVFILRCGERYALEKRGDKGLLAGLWQFPNCLGRLDTRQALEYAKKMGFKITEIRRQVEKMHIFTHIQWKMTGLYAETGEQAPGFCWLTAEEINTTAALPTAFRQFWEENAYV